MKIKCKNQSLCTLQFVSEYHLITEHEADNYKLQKINSGKILKEYTTNFVKFYLSTQSIVNNTEIKVILIVLLAFTGCKDLFSMSF